VNYNGPKVTYVALLDGNIEDGSGCMLESPGILRYLLNKMSSDNPRGADNQQGRLSGG